MATADPRTLLDRAGLAVALQAVALGAGYGSRVAVLAGPGNNGGDGYVAARYLAGRGIAVDIYPLAEPRTDPAIWAQDLARREGARVRRWSDARPADMMIDALFGAGFRGEPPDLSSWTADPVPVATEPARPGWRSTCRPGWTPPPEKRLQGHPMPKPRSPSTDTGWGTSSVPVLTCAALSWWPTSACRM